MDLPDDEKNYLKERGFTSINGHYIMDEQTKEPVECESIIKWAEWYAKADRTLKLTEIRPGVVVSTVFLAMDHHFFRQDGDNHLPVLWETMVFGGKLDQEMERYTSEHDALSGHDEMVRRVKREG